ncbi:hypothetical protein A2973_03885 [Candidatus Gottesmanbacteria bacterium RIFCSPLOWO2_01_FULL_49_10]|uniref:Transport permease protein n=1 Tax=Candidatus Gottesmanbacteria bacterium RIFCSPLOWO2_01_FULL_49_10 TaxID=1798396 RepID=A0A1F6AYE6_9BACT|nr:MAG: hypothetical protein A2973_03885 [Candidatus Gottesmanbacteria bacterium RIFCSPLOWO2_01_FULL_49_10]
MNWSRVGAIMLKHWFDFRRDFFRIFDIFWWPTFQLFIWGLFSLYLNSVTADRPNFVTILLGGVILWTFFDRATRDISRTFIEEIWNRNLPNIFSTPLTVTEYIVGVVGIAVVKLIMSAVFLFFLARVFYAFEPLKLGWYLVPATIGLTFAGWSLSFFIQAIILRYGHTVEVFIWAIAVLVEPFSCVFYPLSALPVWAQRIALFLPTTYIFENLRRMVFGQSIRVEDIAVSFGLNMVYGVLSIWFFYRTFRYAKKEGLLVKYY